MSAYDQLLKCLKVSRRRWLIIRMAGFIGGSRLQTLLDLDQTVLGLDNFATGSQTDLDEVRSSFVWKRISVGPCDRRLS